MGILRYGWEEYQHPDGTPYWVDSRGKEKDSSVFPIYTYR